MYKINKNETRWGKATFKRGIIGKKIRRDIRETLDKNIWWIGNQIDDYNYQNYK
jgi:hypothetical protein